MLGHILSIFAEARINVVDMLNKSRENIAYNLIDVEGEPSAAVIDAISRVDGVINVRLIPAPR
jgi:D-3-phosphoglycerate dehydrogenase